MNVSTLLRLKSIYTKLPRFVQKPINNVIYRQSIKKSLNTFLTKEEQADERLKKEIVSDIKQCRRLYNTKAEEYFLFGFRNLSPDQRAKFLPDHIKDSVLSKIVGFDVFNRELKNKYNFYQMAGRWFGREAMLVDCTGGENYTKFKQFASKHSDLFIKSNVLSKGRGTGLYHIISDKEAENTYTLLGETGGEWIVEEKIIQSPVMAQWNESSVNTVRLPAVLNHGKWTPFSPIMRTGRKGSIVDNAAKGGIITCIDVNDGVLITDGVDENGHYYTEHPDSKITFKKWRIPRWNELLILAEELHRTMPQQVYVGWDFALTEKGWVVVEGNWGQFLSQYNDHIGLKKQFFELLGITE